MAMLSFSLPKYSFAMVKFYDEVADDYHMKDEILRMFPPKRVVHTANTRQVSEPTILDTSMKLHFGEATGDIEIFQQTETTAIFTQILLFFVGSSAILYHVQR